MKNWRKLKDKRRAKKVVLKSKRKAKANRKIGPRSTSNKTTQLGTDLHPKYHLNIAARYDDTWN
jgi:hypothetical protein